MTLFDHAREERIRREAPLAARMRPRTLDEYVGQDHILAPGRLLRRAIQADRLSSLIFYGPPGTGKTTLASVIANTTRSRFIVLNAVLSGVKDVRTVTEEAQRRRGEHNQRTILFVDEVHRWNKAQQDALLPWVENGTVVLVGATTENPYFTVNRALVSRSRIFQLKPLDETGLRTIVDHALDDPERGYGDREVHVAPDALDHLVGIANGDARAVLNALELAVETTPVDDEGRILIDMAVAEESIQQRAVLYDKEGDYHFDTISAFIKSMRGSDPDAAMYWLAKMVYAGEDPRFLFRRMLIFAAEDVGLADPQALVAVSAAADAFDRVGMPEGRYHLGMAALRLATAPKSNSVFAFFDALAVVEKERDGEVPNHLRDASRDKEGFGHGEGYLYPHAYRDHWVAQQYLPGTLQGKVFYQPGDIGAESAIAEQVHRRREAQVAASVSGTGVGAAPPEILTYSPPDRASDRWLLRTVSGLGERLETVRDRLCDLAAWQRHHCVLDLSGDLGFLTWESVRRVPEGGVWCLASSLAAAAAIRQQAERLPELRRPHVLRGARGDLAAILRDQAAPDLRFDRVLGRHVLGYGPARVDLLAALHASLAAGGALTVAEGLPRHTQRLYDLIDPDTLGADLAERLKTAEETIYSTPDDPMVNWDADDLGALLDDAGFRDVNVTTDTVELQQIIGTPTLDRWFAPGTGPADRETYAQRLSTTLEADDVARVEEVFRRQLDGRTVPWRVTTAYIHAVRG